MSTAERDESLQIALALMVAGLGEHAAQDTTYLIEQYRADADPWLVAGALAGMAALLAEFYVQAIGAPGADAAHKLLAFVAQAFAERDRG